MGRDGGSGGFRLGCWFPIAVRRQGIPDGKCTGFSRRRPQSRRWIPWQTRPDHQEIKFCYLKKLYLLGDGEKMFAFCLNGGFNLFTE